MEDWKNIKAWNYMGKRYTWTRKAKNQGYIDCTCKSCQRVVKGLVEDGQLKVSSIPPTPKGASILEAI